MLLQDAFDLLGIDIYAAGYDHVVRSVVQEEVAVGIEVADIADREEVTQARLLGLLFCLVVLEGTPGHLHIDRAALARRQFFAVFVHDDHFGVRPGPTYRARVLLPFVRGSDRASALCCGVVLPDHVAPPIKHLPLGIDGTGRCRMNHRAK